MNRRSTLGVLGLLLGLGLVWFFLLPDLFPTNPGAQGKATMRSPPPLSVAVAPVRRGTLDRRISFTGDVLPQSVVQVHAQIAGVVEELTVEEGDTVQRGEVLGLVEHRELAAQVRQAEARLALYQARYAQLLAGARPEELSQARDRLRKAEANLKKARRVYERAQELFAKHFLSDQDREEAQREYEAAVAEYNIARDALALLRKGARPEERQAALAQVREAEAELELARTRLGHARITAPIDGMVSKRHIDPGDFATPSSPLLTLMNLDRVKIAGHVSERHLQLLHPGQQAEVRVDAYPAERFTGSLFRIGPTMDPVTRTVPVEIHMENPYHRLKPGMFARVELVVETFPDVLFIPRVALLPAGQGTRVFVYHDGKVESRTIRTGYQTDELVVVLDHLQEGEQVIVKGQERLKDGMQVRIP
ncbi:MAG: efflux RND transporter periplasmic adaptor subunit [Nitrospinota bacterium]|nr:MAG: efflux RND transporter periplasmic adaptor subunit [Nitrospinota bacterium]